MSSDSVRSVTTDVATHRCPVRVLPPEDLSSGPPEGSAAIAWNGREWGVAWTERTNEEPAIFFVRVGTDGRRRSMPVRISERGYRGSTPTIAWNGETWNVAFSGGAGPLEEIWLGRVDVRGTPMGRPQRVTARDRRDFTPALAFNGQDLMAVWSAQTPNQRWAILALRMNRWGAQLGPPVRIADRRDRLSSPVVISTSTGWGVAWLVSRTEAIAVDLVRLDTRGQVKGYPVRATLGPLGGTDLTARFGIAWDGENYGLVWDEVRDGAPHVFFDTVSRRIDSTAHPVMISSPDDAAGAPTLAALEPGVFLAAWEVERGIHRHVRVTALDASGRSLGESVEVQGHDGIATMPAMAIGDGAIGLATISTRAVSFHQVQLGPCRTSATDR